MRMINTIENFPSWSICALEYGDFEGLENEEIKQVNRFAEKYAGAYFEYSSDSHFSNSPEFGLACDCVILTVYK